MGLLEQLIKNHSPAENYVQDIPVMPLETDVPVRILAYYLPQFHPIPENDLWWGKGFSEWTNVTKALPRFEGHFQPQLPGHFGFYDLRVVETIREQASLARKYGVSGFCFHRYWFNGKCLLDLPLKLFLDQTDIDIGFCINWANENWSRRWNGGDKEILLEQRHSPEDDIEFAKSIEPFLRDRRYIRVNGRPLIMLYRPNVLPDAASTVRRWRQYFEDAGLGNPYIVMPQAHGDNDPRKYGMDAAAGFPPHNAAIGLTDIKTSLNFFSQKPFGNVHPYEEMVAVALSNNPAEFTLLPGVCPAWDNTARQPSGGTCYHGSNPSAYGRWLKGACQSAIKNPSPDERIVFINAWNEWAEGAHLEPDVHNGYAYLAETRAVLDTLHDGSEEFVQRLPFAEIEKAFEKQSRRMRRSLISRAWRKARRLIADGAESAARRLRPGE